ncbi:MAG: GLUG motif-containing protein, partial [Eubacteriales bacterium]|nr:GLUG motif-containing protein [Eubacteriales bacterium]
IVGLLLSMIVCIAMMPVAVFAETPAAEPAGVWSDYAEDAFAGGTGTVDAPYQIATAGQLAKLAADINSGEKDKNHSKEYFILTEDIDLSAHRWVPIGSGSHKGSFHAFGGHFNGKGNKITGLYVKEERDDYSAGLFGAVGGITIENVIIENGYVEANGRAGILVGNATQAYGCNKQFINCTVSGTVKNSSSTEDGRQSGGLVGYNSYGSYENCTADVNIIGAGKAGGFVGEDYNGKYSNCTAKGKVSGAWFVGGFAGIIWWESNAEKCASYGKVEAIDWNVGGFAGYVKSKVQIKNCVAFSDVTSAVTGGEPKTGGFAGTNDNSTISNSHAAGKITASSSEYVAGGLIGVDASGIYSDCSYDKEKNAELKAAGGASGVETANIAAETTQKVLSNICIDYYDGHDSKTVSAKEATTTEEGWAEHSECSRCGVWLNSEGKETEKELIPKKSSGGGYYNPVQRPEIITGEGGKTSLENNGTTLVITPDEGMQISKVTVNGNEVTVTDNKVTGLKTGDKVEVTFTKIPPTKEELDKAFKEKAGEIELVVRTSKTSKNNIKVTVKLTPALEAFIKEIKSAGYTVKYKFYRSANKSSKYAARITKEEAEYLNTEGKKDKKYYYKAKLLIYDNEGNLVAQTELKQCEYGVRTWSK